MAEKPSADRTEQPTPERLKKAREEGKVPQSQEVPSALVVGLLLIVTILAAGGLYDWLAGQVRAGLSLEGRTGLADNGWLVAGLRDKFAQSLVQMVPFLLAAAVGSVLGCFAVGGWAFSPKSVRLNFSRIAFGSGLQSLFSPRSLVNLLTAMAKMVLVALLVWQYLHNKLQTIISLQWESPESSFQVICHLACAAAGRIAIGLVVIAGIDLLYQRWSYKRQLRMTRQEIKEERRQYELSPEVRVRIRGIQVAMVKKRMLKAVAKADVVVANPTHVAVALQYDPSKMAAPMVVAKGADFLCQKIKQEARKHSVPIVEKPDLARALYAVAEMDKPIPETLFVAVAEVLAMIYRIRGRQQRH